MKRSLNKNTHGFTLIETLVATIIIGIAVCALVMSTISQTQANAFGIDTSTAEFLSEEIRALMMPLSVVEPDSVTATFGKEAGETVVADFDDLDDFDGSTFSPPIDVNGTVLNDFASYSQIITVENVDPANLTNVVADNGSSIVRVSVGIQQNGKEITSTSWIRVNH